MSRLSDYIALHPNSGAEEALAELSAGGSIANAALVTPSDSVDLTVPTRAILCTVAGNVSLNFVESGSAVVIPVLAGMVYPFKVSRVNAASTSATVVALW